MVNQQVLSGKWNEVRGKLKQRWGKLTDDDLRTFNGNIDQLVGRIQQKTGESRDAIEEFLGQISQSSEHVLSHVRERVEETADQAAGMAREGYDALRQSYAEAERIVTQRPGQSVVAAFGLGLISGLALALVLRERTPESRFAAGRSVAERFGKQLADAVASMTPDAFKRT